MKLNKNQFKAKYIVIAASVYCLGMSLAMGGDEIIEFCDFNVPSAITHANASFSVVYSMEIDDSGNPVKINKILNNFLTDELFVNCFIKWKLPPEYKTITIVMNWKHGVGWTQLSLSGKEVHRVFKFATAGHYCSNDDKYTVVQYQK